MNYHNTEVTASWLSEIKRCLSLPINIASKVELRHKKFRLLLQK
ncbi:hypothetical protein GCHA_2379 [Paraglaciecola chathamensis S18K6]|uniref:Uncharacterized protein n=2 Tax=Paraglaciecola chathamensis TaxID=368405 RepID=A0ABQ0I349_9ALTE|nr:hypothetical protein GAGA_0865 [Paraglaciecola agarilytica NO2]GAC10326.1 hypothetical protein GCHA_2379 [Paraglaciecola chathamensis S18K6]